MGHKQLAPTQEMTMTHNLEMEVHPIAPTQDNIAENSNNRTPLEASPVGLVLPRKGARIPLSFLHPPDTPLSTPVRIINSTGDHQACQTIKHRTDLWVYPVVSTVLLVKDVMINWHHQQL